MEGERQSKGAVAISPRILAWETKQTMIPFIEMGVH